MRGDSYSQLLSDGPRFEGVRAGRHCANRDSAANVFSTANSLKVFCRRSTYWNCLITGLVPWSFFHRKLRRRITVVADGWQVWLLRRRFAGLADVFSKTTAFLFGRAPPSRRGEEFLVYEDNLRQFVASEKNVGSARQGKLVGCFFRYVSECSKERRRATALVVLRVFPSLAAALRFRGPVRSGIRIPTTDTSRPVADRLTGGDDSEEMAGRQINVAFTAENAESVAELRANSSRTRHWLPVVVLLLHGTLLAWIDLRSSPTRNELAHLVGGLFVWEFGDFSAYAVNPPLPRAIASVPAACAGLELEEVNRQVARGDRFEWGLRDAYVESYGRRTATHLIWGRLAEPTHGAS